MFGARSDDFRWFYEVSRKIVYSMPLAIGLAPLAKPVRFLGPRAPRLDTFLDGVLSTPPSLLHHGHLFAMPTYSRHREKHWRVSGHKQQCISSGFRRFLPVEFGDFRKSTPKPLSEGLYRFLAENDRFLHGPNRPLHTPRHPQGRPYT